MQELQFQWGRLEEFSSKELHAFFVARESVFIVEQRCPYQEIDQLDLASWHLVGWIEGKVAAYLRVIDPGRKYAVPAIGRVLTVSAFRKKGLGRTLMNEGINRTRMAFGKTDIRISAQTYLISFYTSLGFGITSDEYLEDGIPHIEMTLSSAS